MNKIEGKELYDNLNKARNIDEVCESLDQYLQIWQQKHPERGINFVIGVITSEGKEKEEGNRQRLKRYTEIIRKQSKGFTFCWEDIFVSEIRKNIQADSISYEKFLECSQTIVGGGYISDIYLTPRWEKSLGARLEHKVAQEKGIRLHFLPEEENLGSIL